MMSEHSNGIGAGAKSSAPASCCATHVPAAPESSSAATAAEASPTSAAVTVDRCLVRHGLPRHEARPGRSHPSACASQHVSDGRLARGRHQQPSQILLQGLARPGRPRRQLVADIVGNISDGHSHHARTMAALQLNCRFIAVDQTASAAAYFVRSCQQRMRPKYYQG